MKNKETLHEQAQEKLRQWSDEINKWQDRVNKQNADAYRSMHTELNDLQEKRQTLETNLDAFKKAGHEFWEELVKGVKKAEDELGHAFERARIVFEQNK